ncbi:hypothetical protein ACIBVL_31415 [Streptomyces sp. NPDC049687]|uniref:hypothetical protein n=1 Tax=Streptomyces sp. NPDC049687 TaxID=3365596 RepID=UPI0037A1250E
MRPLHRAALLAAPAALALSSCGIPATGVVEAGGPASGIAPIATVYFVRDGALIAVNREVLEAGDVRSAVEALLQGPSDPELLKRLTTQLPTPTLFPTATNAGTGDAVPAATSLEVTTQRDRVSVALPAYVKGRLTPLAAEQVICTAARAYLLTLPEAEAEAEAVTVTVTGADGGRTEGSAADCPGQ